jgi:hypothetical protein
MAPVFGAFMAVGIVGLVIWIWALVDCLQVPDDSMYRTGTKLIWVLVIVLAQFIGAIVYFAIGRPSRDARTRPPSDLPPPPASSW